MSKLAIAFATATAMIAPHWGAKIGLDTTAHAAMIVAQAQQSQSQREGQNQQGQPTQLSQQDQEFARKAAVGNIFEVEAARVAMEKSDTEQVEDFARRMVEDHSTAQDQLITLARQENFTPPVELDQEHQQKLQKLRDASGEKFDQQYIEGQIKAHRQTIDNFNTEVEQGKNPQLQDFARETLPILRTHLDMATSIASDIGIDAASTRDQQGQSGAAGAERTQIDVDQAAPQITVRDTAPEPEVTIKKPEPEVNVTMPEPKVDVEQAPPQVEVDRAEPEVGVRQGEPIVGVEQPAPEVEVDQARPNVEVSRAQPQVEVDTAEPQVRVQRDEAAAQLAEGKAAAEEVAAVAGAEGGDAGAAGTVPDNPLYLLTADELVGRTVTGAAGEEIGDIEDIVIGRDDQKLYAVLSVGGFLGIGARDVAVPFESLIIGEDDRLMLEGMTKEELTSLSAYDRTTYVSVERDVLLRESL